MPNLIETPDSACILTLTSSAFNMSYPKLVNETIIPSDILRAMLPTWRTLRFAERPVKISVLNDVYVAEEGLVFDAHGNLYAGSITQHAAAEIQNGYEKVRTTLRSGETTPVAGTVVLCKKRGAANFGHWLMEMLPKAYLVKLYLQGEDTRYLVPSVTGALRDVVNDSLAMLNIPRAITIASGNEVLSIGTLLLVEGLTEHGVYMSPLVMGGIDSLSARVPGTNIGKVFVTRPGNAARRLLNEEALVERALARGYILVDTATMNLADQVKTFKNAHHVVGVMGAAMTNIAFAPRGARITNLAPAKMPDTFFWFIAGLRNQRYEEVRCAQSGSIQGVADWDRDMILQETDLDGIFEN